MQRVFGGKNAWLGILPNSLRASQSRRPFCSSIKQNNNGDNKLDRAWSQYDEVYKQLDKLDFMTSAKILFTAPAVKRKFGIDFHLVQLFFVCMPSLAVYLVAKYARYEMRRMEAELELKRKAEEEVKAKELELKAAEEKESASDPELQQVKVRLGKLEEAIKGIAVLGSKKHQGSTVLQKQDEGERAATSSVESSSASKELAAKGTTKDSVQQERSGSLPITDASQRNQKPQDKTPRDKIFGVAM